MASSTGQAQRATPTLTFRRALKILGPGLITGASDDDPSGIAVYAQAGAEYGFRSLWTTLLCLPLMIAVQGICDHTAEATGSNLGELVRKKFGPVGRALCLVLLVGLLVANLINVAADLMAIGSGFALIHAGPAWIWTLLAGVACMSFVALGSFHQVSRVLRLLCLSLLAYPIVLFMAHVDWGKVGLGLVGLAGGGGHGYWQLIVGVLGTTLSPYLLFWQSAQRAESVQEKEETGEAAELDHEPTKRGRRNIALQDRLDVITGMVLAEVVMFSIITATAATVGSSHKPIQTAADAAKVFKPLAGGSLASILFAAGFIGTGLLAVPALAGSAATAIAGLRGKPWGFGDQVRQAPLFYVLVAIGTVGGTVVGVFYADPIGLLVAASIINGIAAAPFMVLALLIARDRKLMKGSPIHGLATTLGWAAVAAMGIAGVFGIVTL